MTQKTNKKRRILYLIILTVFSILLVSINLLWITKDKSPPYCSHLVYLIMSREYFEILLRGEFFDFLVNTGNFYPPLPFQITAVFYKFFGYGGVQAVLSQAVFWIILIFSTFLLGSYLWDDDVGFVSAFTAASIPQNVFFMRSAGVDIPITAMVPLCLYCLFRSDKFKNTKWTFLFFISLSIGMLLKWVFVVFIFLPALIIFLWTAKDLIKNRETVKEFIIFIIAVICFMVIYYLSLIYMHGLSGKVDMANLVEVYYLIFTCLVLIAFVILSFALKSLSKVLLNISRGLLIFLCLTAHFVVIHLVSMKNIYNVWFWDVQYNLLLPVRTFHYFFIKFLIHANFGIPFFILFLVGVFVYCFSKEKNFKKNILLLSILFAVIFLYTQPVYDARYFMPLNSIVAIFISFWIFKIKNWGFRIPIFLIMAVLAIFYIAGWMFVPEKFIKMEGRLGRVNAKPYISTNKLNEAADYILNLYRTKKPEKGLLVVADDDSSNIKLTPLLILYHLRKARKTNETAALLYRGEDPIFAEKNEPWGFFITEKKPEKDDDPNKDEFYSKDIEEEMRQKGKKTKEDTDTLNRLESSEINTVEADIIYFCRFRDMKNPKKFPVELLKSLKNPPAPEDIKKEPVYTTTVLDNTIIDIYKIK